MVQRSGYFAFVVAWLCLCLTWAAPLIAQDRVDAESYDWQPAPTPVRREVMRAFPVGDIAFDPSFTVSVTDVPFYSETRILRVAGAWEPEALELFFLDPPLGPLVYLDGAVRPLQSLNAMDRPVINAETVRPYLWYFTFFDRSAGGPYLLAEFADDPYLPSAQEMGPQMRDAFAGQVQPAECAPDVDGFLCEVVAYHQGRLVAAKIAVRSDGRVEVVSEEEVLAALPAAQLAPISLEEAAQQSVADGNAADVAPAAEDTRAVEDEALADSGQADDLLALPQLDRQNRDLLAQLLEGPTVPINRTTIPFLAGVAQGIVVRCGAVISGPDQRRLMQFATDSVATQLLGGDYSADNLLDGIESMTTSAAGTALGQYIGERASCTQAIAGAMAVTIVQSLETNAQANTFVNTCPLGRSECECLARMATGVIPDIHDRPYHRSLVAELIERNPFLALQVGLTCGISNY